MNRRRINSGALSLGSRIGWAAAFAFIVVLPLQAQARSPQNTPSMASGPTPVRIMAIGRVVAGAPAEQLQTVLETEVRETVKLYLAGKIDQWYAFPDRSGVIFLLNVQTVSEAHALLDPLPLGQAHLMEFQFLPVGPLAPLLLLANTDAGGTRPK